MKVSQVKDYGTRKLIYVVDEAVPESYHLVSGNKVAHTGSRPAGISPTLKAYEWCKVCHHDNPIEFKWDDGETEVALNKWGNPARKDEKVVGSRAKAWDELYNEIEVRLKGIIDRGSAPRETPPALVPEVEPEFAAFPVGEPVSVDNVVSRKYRIEHNGQPAGTTYDFEVSGTTAKGFKSNYNALFLAAQQKIKNDEVVRIRAEAIAI